MVQTIDLNGQWYISYEKVKRQKIQVPSAVESVLEDRSFTGPFVYEKCFKLEKKEEQAHYFIEFLGVSYFCQVYCNNKLITSHEGIWDAFEVDITQAVQEGENNLTVKVIKPDFNKESSYFFRSVLFGFIPDIMFPFGGIWKDVSLKIKGKNYFKKITTQFDTTSGSIVIESNLGKEKTNETLVIKVLHPQGKETEYNVAYKEKLDIKIEDIKIWSPLSPYLYKVTIALRTAGETLDCRRLKAGFRKIQLKDGEIILNDKPFFMRGILHWGCYPEKMRPYPSYEEVKKELLNIKKLGFNTIKHCLYFPPTYYYELCDELGIVTWQELPLWLPFENRHMLQRVYTQYPKMMDYFMIYPSVSLVSLGCELDATISSNTLNDLYKMVKDKDAQMIICDNSGSGECFEGVSHSSSDIYDYHFYAELYNLDHLIDEFTKSYREVKPWIFGEYNDSDTFRLVKDIKTRIKTEGEEAWWLNPDEKVNLLRQVHKGFGSDLPIYNQEKILEEYGITEEVDGIQDLSYRQMHSIRKHILERTRSYNQIKGYNITAIRDVPITTSGIFDDHMESKFEESMMKKINGDIVVAFNKDLTRIWDNGADRFLNKDLYNYFAGDILKGRLTLSNRSHKMIEGKYEIILKDADHVYFTFKEDCKKDKHKVEQLAQLAIKLPEVKKVTNCQLIVNITYLEGSYTNDWDIWIYPKVFTQAAIYLLDYTGGFVGIEKFFNVKRLKNIEALETLKEGEVLLTTILNKKIESYMEKGICIIGIQKGEGYVPLTYNPFYREGIKIIFEHKITNQLGHLGYAGMQFYGVGTDRYFDKLDLEKSIGTYKTLIRRYDARKFVAGDYLIEYEKDRGKMLLTTLNLDGGQGSQPYNFAYNCFAIWLLNRMVNYLEG